MAFIDDYNELIKHAKSFINKQRIDVLPEDLVNEAYIVLHDSGKEYNKRDAIACICKSSYKELSEKNTKNRLDDVRGVYHSNKNLVDCTCRKCKQVLPSGMFRSVVVGGCTYQRFVCKVCQKKQGKEWMKKNRDKVNAAQNKRNWAKGKKTRAQWVADLRAKSKYKYVYLDAWKKASKKKYDKEKGNLSDAYVKHLLRAGGKDFSSEDIMKKRLELIEKLNKTA